MYNFPNNPTLGQIAQFPSASQQYIWNGSSWDGAPLSQEFVTASAVSASYSETASYALTASYSETTSLAETASFAITASYSIVNFVTSSVTSSVSASYSSTASLAYTANTALTASYFLTGSVTSASFAQTARSASFATTASYVQLAPGSQVLFSTTGSWNLIPGDNAVSFTVAPGGTYTMWLYGNIPNGIIAWNATATISNTNVGVVGAQYAWVYTGGGTTLDLLNIPTQFIGTSGSIMKTSGTVSGQSNIFNFYIRNASGANQQVYYGYTKL